MSGKIVYGPGQLIHRHTSAAPPAPIGQIKTTGAATPLSRRRPSTSDSEMGSALDHKHALTSPSGQLRTPATPTPTAFPSPASTPLHQRAASVAPPAAAEPPPQAEAPDNDPFWVGLQVCQQVCFASHDPDHVSIEQAVGHFVQIGQTAPEQLPWLFSGFTQGLDLAHMSKQLGGRDQAEHRLNQIVDQLMAHQGEMGRHDLQRCLHAIALASHTDHPNELHRVDYAPTLKGADRLVTSQDGGSVWAQLATREAAIFLYDPQARGELVEQAFIPNALGIDGVPFGAVAAWANGLRGVYLTPLLSGSAPDAAPPLPRKISLPPTAIHEPDLMPEPSEEVDPVEPGPEVGIRQESRRLSSGFDHLENLKRSEINNLAYELEGDDDNAYDPLEIPPDAGEHLANAELLREIHRILLAWPLACEKFQNAQDVLDHVSDDAVHPQGIEAAQENATGTGEAVAHLARDYLDLTRHFGDTSLAEQIEDWLDQARRQKEEDAFARAMETGLPREAIESYLNAAESVRDSVARDVIANAVQHQRHRYTTDIGDLEYRLRQERRKEEIDPVEERRLQNEIDLREILLRNIEGQLKHALWEAKQRMDDIRRIFEHRSLEERAPALGKIEFLLAVLEGKSLKRWDTD